MEIRECSAVEASEFADELAAFERQFRYPLGDDFFSIDHGADYLAFFRTLGKPRLLLALDGTRIAGVLVAVERQAERGPRMFYLGDLKVDPERSGALLGIRLLHAFDALACGEPAYGVSMNPSQGRNRLAALLARVPGADVRIATRLVFFSLDYDAWRRVERLCREAFGAIGWVDHRGRKDIVLESTGAPMPLLHLQHGPFARLESDGPREGHVHMFCVPDSHELVAAIARAGCTPAAHATVLARRCHGVDAGWSFVLTSDI